VSARQEPAGALVELTLPADALEAIAHRAADLVLERLGARPPQPARPYLTVPEAAVYLSASSRQRVDDLLSQGRLTRVKDGRRTLVARSELDAYLAGAPTGRVAHALPSRAQTRMGKGRGQ
jgi:excisionase family DNA binding protein